jgi:hypothetical protein
MKFGPINPSATRPTRPVKDIGTGAPPYPRNPNRTDLPQVPVRGQPRPTKPSSSARSSKR